VLIGVNYEDTKISVMSRWECVEEYVDHVLKYKPQWLEATNSIVSTDQTGSTKHTIASYLIYYLGEQMIIARLYFLKDIVGAGGTYTFNGIRMLTPKQRLQDFWNATWP